MIRIKRTLKFIVSVSFYNFKIQLLYHLVAAFKFYGRFNPLAPGRVVCSCGINNGLLHFARGLCSLN